MNFLFSFFSTIFFFKNSNSFFLKNKNQIKNPKRISKIYMENTEFQELNNIRYFRDYFPKETYNDVIQHITKQDISKIFINTDYSQLVSVDKNVSPDDISYIHYHSVIINPMVTPNIIEQSSNYHIPITFIDFTPFNISNADYL